MFSTYYALDRSRNPYAHCALNVALYGDEHRFAMTERGARALDRDAAHLTIGPSGLTWDGTALTIRIDERTAPIPRAVRGTVRLIPEGVTDRAFPLDGAGRHRWWPISPSSRVEVDLDAPRMRWQGTGYFDTNAGDAPLEEDFLDWTWCRADLRDGAAILYDVRRRDGSGQNLSLRFGRDGTRRDIAPPVAAALAPTRLWRMPRSTRSDDGAARVLRTFEDTPFYARSLLSARLAGEAVRPVHESLSLTRLRHPLVRVMLPFRMPRALG